ncbi:hypothetical protein J3R83DRAFT_146 [Lanmaoa asiatica]|nr:hypothetical protein J3R83DRAFT_146 [Lanmaoa asiatica]
MADISSEIESSSIPSIKSLKSRFEQFALDNASPSYNAHPKPTSVSPAPIPPQSRTVVAPESTPTPRFITRVSLTSDDCILQSQLVAPVCNLVRSKGSASDLKAAALKRAPPPPPPPRIKKPPSSPVASPLLRPVPVPAALRSPRASPEREPLAVRSDHQTYGAEGEQ